MKKPGESGVPWGRVREAEVWGKLVTLHCEDGLTVHAAIGAYGTLYEIEISSSWALWRMSAIVADLLPRGLMFVPLDDVDDEEDEGLTIHFWDDKGT